jgi:hypothetical protein
MVTVTLNEGKRQKRERPVPCGVPIRSTEVENMPSPAEAGGSFQMGSSFLRAKIRSIGGKQKNVRRLFGFYFQFWQTKYGTWVF